MVGSGWQWPSLAQHPACTAWAKHTSQGGTAVFGSGCSRCPTLLSPLLALSIPIPPNPEQPRQQLRLDPRQLRLRELRRWRRQHAHLHGPWVYWSGRWVLGRAAEPTEWNCCILVMACTFGEGGSAGVCQRHLEAGLRVAFHQPLNCLPFAGSAILKFTSKLATCPVHTGNFLIPAYGQCSTWSAGTGTGGADPPSLKLALEVAPDCSITVKPITDTSCADSGAVLANPAVNKLYPLNTAQTYAYTYNSLLIRAYYTSTTSIRTLLPSDEAGARYGLGHGFALVDAASQQGDRARRRFSCVHRCVHCCRTPLLPCPTPLPPPPAWAAARSCSTSTRRIRARPKLR